VSAAYQVEVGDQKLTVALPGIPLCSVGDFNPLHSPAMKDFANFRTVIKR
jgi:hypothetical protein